MQAFSALACIVLSIMSARGVVSDCQMTADGCEFHLSIDHHFTMMKGKYAVYPSDGNLYKYDVVNTSTATPEDQVGIIQADGYEPQRLMTLANGTMPGPAIEVYEGQMVTVHVTNHLFNEGVTIHWHGLHQKGTPFMDGVAFITQCPILPGQTFTYKFKAEPKGTFWYHSHMGNQRTMGLFGPLIIREKKAPEMEEFIMHLQDWNHDDSTTVHLKMNFGGFENRKELKTTDALDGSHFSRFFMTSGLINGKGRLYDSSGRHNGAPLSVFTVDHGKMYKFRVIAAGHLYPFRVSIDGHELTIVASDGYDLQPQPAESFVINPGERIDFIINATNAVGNYWVRAQTLEAGVDHKAEAILRYEGANETEPETFSRDCTATEPCVIVNCPFTYYPISHSECLKFDQLRSLADDDPAPPVIPGKFKEHFLNFAFPGIEHYPGQVNGHKFKMPSVSGLTQLNEITTTCDKEDCGEDKTCYCTNMLNLTHEDTVQMVLLNREPGGTGWNHPIHLHGHSFYVLKMGYAQHNESNGKLIGDNLDIDCGNTTYNFCNFPSWTNKSWNGDDIPGLELANPPRKDTIIVPSGGYVVIRIRANNPGFWFMHCHIEMHNKDGMAMVVNEAPDHFPTPPKDFPRCSSFGPEVTYEVVNDTHVTSVPEKNATVTTMMTEKSTTMTPEKSTTDKNMGNGQDMTNQEMMYRYKVFWTVVGCLIGVCALQFIIIFCMCCRRCEGSGREKWTPQSNAAPQINQGYVEK